MRATRVSDRGAARREGACRRAVLAAVLLAGACVEREPVTGRAPLAEPTPLEQAYLACMAVDPLFATQRCREVRARLSGDPFPGSGGR